MESRQFWQGMDKLAVFMAICTQSDRYIGIFSNHFKNFLVLDLFRNLYLRAVYKYRDTFQFQISLLIYMLCLRVDVKPASKWHFSMDCWKV